jgi:hypothetical protein
VADPVRDFASDEDGEWIVQAADFTSVAGQAAVEQGIRTRLRMFLEDCFLDDTVGVDYVGQILIKDADPLVVRELLRTAIVDTPDVTSVTGSQLDGPDSNRDATIAYTADSIYSEQPFSAQVDLP